MTGTAEWIGNCAWNALIEEVNTTPKPGLVDLYSNGAHTDMDAETFRRSAEALRPFFVKTAREGLSFDGSAEELFMGLSSGRDWNRVKLQALLTLMAHTEDSNILSRHNPAVLRDVQEEMLELLRCGGAYREDAIKLLEDMDADYSRRGISAGGCADLLAAAIFILELTEGCRFGED